MPGTILLVEDNRLIAYSLQMALQSRGYTVVTAHAAADAVETANISKPHIIIMDVNLGGEKDGVEVMQQIHDQIGFISHLYLTGYSEEELSNHIRITSPATIIEKPVDIEPLCQVLDGLLPSS